MKRTLSFIALLLLVVAGVAAVVGYRLPDGYTQGLLANAAAELVGLAVALMLVNHYLSASEKAEAAAPLVKLIAPAIQELHNDLFVEGSVLSLVEK